MEDIYVLFVLNLIMWFYVYMLLVKSYDTLMVLYY